MTESFADDMFPGTVTFRPPATGVDSHAVPIIGGETGGTVYPAYVEPYGRGGGREEGHHVPEGRSIWWVHTPTNPGASVDWLCLWGTRLLRVIAPSATQDGWDVWRTDCTEVI